MDIVYNWQASLVVLVAVIATVQAGRFLAFLVPQFAQARDHNKEENRAKYKANKRDYRHRIKTSKIAALGTYVVFFVVALPFIVTFEPQPIWQAVLDIFVILMVYDFFYYLMHRFLFHGKGYFRQVHAVHHQARNPTSLDSLLLHPMEAFLGVFLFVVVTTALFFVLGAFHVATMAICIVIYTQINTFNHVDIDLDYFPFKVLNWIAHKHSIHHIDMHKGNYATITLFFDKVFGTLD